MRRDEVAAVRRVQTDFTVQSNSSPRKTSEHWRQLAFEVRRLDVALERILLVMERDLNAFVRARNAAKW